MYGGKGELKPSQRNQSGIVTRASKPSSMPRPSTPGTPKAGVDHKDHTDTQRVLDRLDKIEISLESKIDDAIKGQELAASILGDRITKADEKVLVQTEQISALKDNACGVKVQLKVHGTRINEIEEKIERIEREKRRSTLIIEGLKETEGEIISTLVDKALTDLKVGFRSKDCTAIFRRGGRKDVSDKKEETGAREKRIRIRPIVVFLPSANEKAEIFRNLKNLKDNEEWKGVFFNDDLTEQQANEQRDLRALSAYAKTKNFNSNVKAGALWLDGRRYRY